MKTFKDTEGRSWAVRIDVDAIRRVRTALKVNLVGNDLGQVLEQVLGDPVLLCDVLYCLLKPEADKLGVSDVDFGRALAGDVLEQAAIAFLEELADFTPNARDRARVQRAVKALLAMTDKARDLADKLLETDLARAEEELLATVGRSSGKSPAPSASTPGH